LSRQTRHSTVKLKDAPVIVSGGAGVGSAEEFASCATWPTCSAAKLVRAVPQSTLA